MERKNTKLVAKSVLVIDEAQDMSEEEYALVDALMEQNEGLRVIAIGDDDQNIFAFRGASSQYMSSLIHEKGAHMYEITENFRSRRNLVEFSNQFVRQIKGRLKTAPLTARQSDNGKLKIVRYNSQNLISPLVNDLLNTGLSGTTCVLTKTNEEALMVCGLLLKKNMPARLIQSNDGFNLYDLVGNSLLLWSFVGLKENRLNHHRRRGMGGSETKAFAQPCQQPQPGVPASTLSKSRQGSDLQPEKPDKNPICVEFIRNPKRKIFIIPGRDHPGFHDTQGKGKGV